MKFYLFNQNNSGGSFVVDDNLTHRVLIEADTVDEAIERAENLGMYWHGVEDGYDCPCCGDRWYTPDDEGMKFPFEYSAFEKEEAEKIAKKYHAEVVENNRHKDRYNVIFKTPEIYLEYMADEWGYTDPNGYIHYKSGRKVIINGRGKK